MADDELPHVDPPRETRHCAVCGAAHASFGFGPPGVLPADAWYCAEHRADGERGLGGAVWHAASGAVWRSPDVMKPRAAAKSGQQLPCAWGLPGRFYEPRASDLLARPLVSPGVRREQPLPPRPLLGGLIGQQRPYRSQVVMQRGDVGLQLLARNLDICLGCPGR